jgi:TonB family protein
LRSSRTKNFVAALAVLGGLTSCAATSGAPARRSIGAYGARGDEGEWSRALRKRVLARWFPYDIMDKPSFQSSKPPRPTTVLAMRIGPDGRVSDLRVLRPSGVQILDERALAAVRATAPLPAPPLALRDASGMVTFELGFRVYRTTDTGDPREDEKRDTFAVIYTAPASDWKLGSLPKEQIKAAIDTQRDGSLKDCYERRLGEGVAIEGRLLLRFVIELDGTVKDIVIMRSDGLDSTVENCALDTVAKWRFPSPAGGKIVVDYPFVFKMDRDEATSVPQTSGTPAPAERRSPR